VQLVDGMAQERGFALAAGLAEAGLEHIVYQCSPRQDLMHIVPVLATPLTTFQTLVY